MKMMRCFACFLCFFTVMFLFSCNNGGKTATDQISGTSSIASSETENFSTADSTSEQTENSTILSQEEKEMEAHRAFLDTVTYLNYELTGETTPYFMGRWFEKDIDGVSHHVTLTDGSAFYFLIHGADSFEIQFTVITEKEEPYFAYSIDGAAPIRQHITDSTVILPDNGRHTVRIIADGMTEQENKWQGEKGFAFKSLVPSDGGEILGIQPVNKVIFYYGDSITEGVRALNMSANSNGNSATHAYPWFCSEILGAVTYSVGYGASGVTVQGSFRTFMEAIDYNSSIREVHDGIVPDVIVINHGTNDKNANAETFKQNLADAVRRLREKYPDAVIVYLIPFIQFHAQDIREVMHDFEGTYVIETEEWEITYTDSGYHPDAAGAKIAGENLADALIEILGEDFFLS